MSEQRNRRNLFATILTYPAPSANYRGESELNRSVIQKVTDGKFEYPIISPEAMRNALREILIAYGLPSNRTRLPDEDQLAVRFADFPDPNTYVDDFFFGYLMAANTADRKKQRAQIAQNRGEAAAQAFEFKRDSVLRMNLARALAPYRHNAIFTQSPQDLTSSDIGRLVNDTKSNLLHRETAVTAFQYPFALSGEDCKSKPDWTKALLKAIGELNGVAGNHARSYYEMAPASIIVRLTQQLVAGYDTYGFRIKRSPSDDQAHTHEYAEVVNGLLHDPPDYTPSEFFIGGKIVKDMDDATSSKLTDLGVKLDRDPRRLLQTVAAEFTKGMA